MLLMCIDVLKLSYQRRRFFKQTIVSVKMNLDSGKTNTCRNRLLLNPKGIFIILRDRVIPTIVVHYNTRSDSFRIRMVRF